VAYSKNAIPTPPRIRPRRPSAPYPGRVEGKVIGYVADGDRNEITDISPLAN